ncbi:MAG: hypothetical protein JWO97_4296 [Acidobacteria bacterium]|nr:hypothetical protein [Acidobacteriota bacterium]
MRRPGSVAFLLLFLMVSAVARGEECPLNKPVGNVINLKASQSTTDTYMLENPIPKTAPPDSVSMDWRTEDEMMNGGTPSPTFAGRFPLAVGYCTTVNGAASIAFPTSGTDSTKLRDAAALAVQYAPTETANGQEFVRYLRIKWKEAGGTEEKSATYKIVAKSGAPDYASDSRYKLWLYTGYTFMRSKSDFKDGYPELLLRAETRWTDGRIFMMQHSPDKYAVLEKRGCKVELDPSGGCPWREAPSFAILRIYGEAGLMGTTIAVNGSDTTTLGKIKQTFGANVGIGYGHTYLVSTRDPKKDTNAFAALGVVRLGLTTIPGLDKVTAADGTVTQAATEGRSAFNYSANIRIENEPSFREDAPPGNFEGAYFEFGWGESEQFGRKKFPRLRVDGMLPFGGTSLLRFAGRLQIDAPRPFASRKSDSPDNLANEIRISIIFNMDLLELGKRIGGK